MSRVGYGERADRPGWDVRYTNIGGRWPKGTDVFEGMDSRLAHHLKRYTAQAFIACTAAPAPVSGDLRYWSTICTKLIQRGSNPPISPRAVELLESDDGERPAFGLSSHQASIPGLLRSSRPWDLDPSIELHQQWEVPFWERVIDEAPGLVPWVTPQVSLEALCGIDGGTSRWVDYMCWLPGSVPTVVELDGSGHGARVAVDQEREHALRKVKIELQRLVGSASLSVAMGEALGVSPPPEVEPHERLGVLRSLLGPACVNRLAFALVEAATRGFLPSSRPWVVDLDDLLGVASNAAGAALDLLAAVDDLWATSVVPREVTISGRRWIRGRYHYEPAGHVDPGPADVHIALDPDRPPHAALVDRASPQIVIRHAFLPASFRWVEPLSSERRDLPVDGDRDTSGPLHGCLREVFGHSEFTDGQLPAIQRGLQGEDGLAMLPTGSGKSLVYQMIGLLRPGVTVVVDPITALIDDQVLRLKQQGIDRATPLHSAMKGGSPGPEVHEVVASGESYYVFISPERLQIQRFRDALGTAAARVLVNLAVVDEAHCVSEWGHDFRPSYLRLGRNLRLLCRGDDDVPPALIALTGTASPAVLRDLLRELEIPRSSIQTPESFDRPNLHYRVMVVQEGAMKSLLRSAVSADVPAELGVEPAEFYVPKGEETASGVFFVPHVNGKYGLHEVQRTVADAVVAAGAGKPRVEVFSGTAPKGVDPKVFDSEKALAAEHFKQNESQLLVATKAFGMGIDKPNIRFTLHVGFPSSIEAFAQEAGRAGRDGDDCICVLASEAPSPELPPVLLDFDGSFEARREAFMATNARNDLRRQLFFHYGSFGSAADDTRDAVAVFDELWSKGDVGKRVSIPRPWADGAAKDRERALYRLSTLGIVDDYTIDFGAGSFTVDLDYFDGQTLLDRWLEYAMRIEPGRQADHRRSALQAPDDLVDQVAYYLELEIELLYRVIEPARLRALDEMYRLTLNDPSDEEIRRRINAYLGHGLMASVLEALISSADRIDAAEVIAVLDRVPPIDPFEWAGVAARQLEVTPDHPVAILVGALAQAWLPDGDESRFRELVASCLRALNRYGTSDGDVGQLFVWALRQLSDQFGGQRSHWRAVAWQVLGDQIPGEDVIEREEEVVLVDARRQYTTVERRLVLDRRLRRDIEDMSRFVGAHVGESIHD